MYESTSCKQNVGKPCVAARLLLQLITQIPIGDLRSGVDCKSLLERRRESKCQQLWDATKVWRWTTKMCSQNSHSTAVLYRRDVAVQILHDYFTATIFLTSWSFQLRFSLTCHAMWEPHLHSINERLTCHSTCRFLYTFSFSFLTSTELKESHFMEFQKATRTVRIVKLWRFISDLLQSLAATANLPELWM